MLHVYREANACVDALAKRGVHQHHVLSVYSSCPSFVYVFFVRDMAGLGSNRICAQRPTVGDVRTPYLINKTSVSIKKKKNSMILLFDTMIIGYEIDNYIYMS